MVDFAATLALGSLKGMGGLGSFGKTGGIGSLGKTGILGKLGILLFLGRIGFHGIWGIGAFFLMIFVPLVGILYLLYRHRMSQI